MTRRDPLSLPEHRELGRRLYAAYSAAVRDHAALANAYGARSAVAMQADRAVTQLGKLRSVLEEQMLRDQPTLDNDSLRIYYPGAGRE